ncbi:hypothetical protein, partial [Caldithrix abyssi]
RLPGNDRINALKYWFAKNFPIYLHEKNLTNSTPCVKCVPGPADFGRGGIKGGEGKKNFIKIHFL